jgi:spore germination protein GerM
VKLIASLCLVVALVGCGVEGQSNAHVFDESEVPSGLIGTAPPSTAPVIALAPFASTTEPSSPYELYFIRGGVLVSVPRRASATPTVGELVTTLVQGPTQDEVSAGFRSAIASVDIVTKTRESSTTVTVDLARAFNDIPRGDRILALGQITLTLTARAGVSLVQYTIADTPIEVPKANGVVTRDPVTRSDYTALLVPPAPSSVNVPSTTVAPATSR